jgi:hypothetical protein
MNPGKRSRAFIGASSEASAHAKALQQALSEWSAPEIWNQGFFRPTLTTIEALEAGIGKFDFAALLLTPDDFRITRGKKGLIPRDNLIFEAGLCFGILGRKRTFLLCPAGSEQSLPSDLSALTVLRYNSDTENLHAAFGPASSSIEQALKETTARGLNRSLGEIEPAYIGDVESIQDRVQTLCFSRHVIRHNWHVNLWYDLSDATSKGIVTEHLSFEYDLVNISNKPIKYDVTLTTAEDETTNELFGIFKNDNSGKRIPVFTSEDIKRKQAGFIVRETIVEMLPGVTHFTKMDFVYRHPACRKTHHVHNVLTVRDPIISARMTVDVPKGYTFIVLVGDPVKPNKFGGRWTFRIPHPLLALQAIEYLFKKDETHT